MSVLLIALHILFFAPVLVRLIWRTDGATGGSDFVEELLVGVRKPAMVVHGAGLLLLWMGVVVAILKGQVERMLTTRGAVGALMLIAASLLMAWCMVTLQAWRLLPLVRARDELCTTGPYALVRHPMYLAIDLLGLGSAVWVGTPWIALGALVLVLGGELRSRLEERVLVEAFGERYRAYAEHVSRILPWPRRAPRH